MGSGISLNKEQIIYIIKRELTKEFYEKQNNKNITCDGCLIYYDFSDEVEYTENNRNAMEVNRYFPEFTKENTNMLKILDKYIH